MVRTKLRHDGDFSTYDKASTESILSEVLGSPITILTAYEGSTNVVYDTDTETAAKQEEKLNSGELASAAGVNVLDV